MTGIKFCGAVIFRKTDKLEVLLIKHLESHWGFPKGKNKDNETEEETAIRKVKEETGYQIEIKQDFREISSYLSQTGIYKEVIYFIGNIKGGTILTNGAPGIEKALWLPYNNALALLTYSSDINILKKVKKHFQQIEI